MSAGNDDFEKGRCWTLYKYMEEDFLRFMEYVPYTEYNSKVYSPKLLAMLLQICGYIDSVFKIMTKFPRFAAVPECKAINDLEADGYRQFNIHLAREAFEKIYRLSSNNEARITAKLDWLGNKKCKPFADFAHGESPRWWSAYNRVKHTWSSALDQANMENVLDALGGALLLNMIRYPSMKILHRLTVLYDIAFFPPDELRGYGLDNDEFEDILVRSFTTLKPYDRSYGGDTRLFHFTYLRPLTACEKPTKYEKYLLKEDLARRKSAEREARESPQQKL